MHHNAPKVEKSVVLTNVSTFAVSKIAENT